MTKRPHVLLSVASSVDGYIDDTSEERLILSNAADFDRVDEVRASVDAILVGANTIRRDNPRLLVRSADRRAARRADGRPESPVKVTVTQGGDLDPQARFFTEGDVEKLVYTSTVAVEKVGQDLHGVATVVDAGEPLSLAAVLSDLADRGLERLMVEGGGTVHTQILTSGLADELHLVLAPFFIGDPEAPRFANPGQYLSTPDRPMELAEVRQIGNVVFLRYHIPGT